MVYIIIAVNPMILTNTGVPFNQVFTATIIATGIALGFIPILSLGLRPPPLSEA